MQTTNKNVCVHIEINALQKCCKKEGINHLWMYVKSKQGAAWQNKKNHIDGILNIVYMYR